MSVRTISPRELVDLQTQGRTFELIDVRTPVEYREVHASSARLIPLDRLDPRSWRKVRNGFESQPLDLICRTGARSRQACESFQACGFPNVMSVEGGTLDWLEAGLPVIRGRKAMGLERQVRIAVGSMVCLGTALGLFVHPGFLGLSAFIGAGLVFAGITDTCGMGMVLARMPWNRAREVQPEL